MTAKQIVAPLWTLKRADGSGGNTQQPTGEVPSPPVLGFENWGPQVTGPASDRRYKPKPIYSGLKFVLPAMLAKGFGPPSAAASGI